MARRSYTDDERTAALALYAEQGPTAVQDQLGIPKQTVASWAAADGVRTVRNERTGAAVAAQRLAWEERRLELVHEMGRVAAKALKVAEDQLDNGTTSRAKDATTTMAILVDKAQLLSGGATGREYTHHVRDEVVADARSRALRLVG